MHKALPHIGEEEAVDEGGGELGLHTDVFGHSSHYELGCNSQNVKWVFMGDRWRCGVEEKIRHSLTARVASLVIEADVRLGLPVPPRDSCHSVAIQLPFM